MPGESIVLMASQEDWDAARRCAEAVNVHVAAYREHLKQGRGKPGFVAIRLDDGRSPDGVMYDTRREATRHQPPYPRGMMYVKVQPEFMTPKLALIQLKGCRYSFERGVVFTEEEIVFPHRLEDLSTMVPATFLSNPWRM